jgi:hypothetical protein
MTRPFLAVSTTLLFAVVAAQTQLHAGQPSTPEDRAKAVAIARCLETDPLGPQAQEQRQWVIRWLIEVPDIHVKACNLVGPVMGSKKNYGSEIFAQTLASSAAFIIENPNKADDEIAVYTASLEGALRAYESILKAKPKAKWPFLDDLIEKRAKGELLVYIREAATHCK